MVDAEFQQQVVYKQAKPLGTPKHSTSSKSSTRQYNSKKKTTPTATSKINLTTEPTMEDLKDEEDMKDVEDGLVKLKDVFREELMMFVANKGKLSVDYPPSLSSLERKALHEVCKSN